MAERRRRAVAGRLHAGSRSAAVRPWAAWPPGVLRRPSPRPPCPAAAGTAPPPRAAASCRRRLRPRPPPRAPLHWPRACWPLRVGPALLAPPAGRPMAAALARARRRRAWPGRAV